MVCATIDLNELGVSRNRQASRSLQASQHQGSFPRYPVNNDCIESRLISLLHGMVIPSLPLLNLRFQVYLKKYKTGLLVGYGITLYGLALVDFFFH